ncbi:MULTISPECIES: replication-associated recombination protein A [unclassified Sphingomonas]|uniref:replication-associated recombination protein A n=1 Tax=unclassified Sphingomonas TaxID=196159 RepID=UPI0006F337C1|nr:MULTISPECIES: replication-associated recombination protein A [unclassified Sphingomonas]KQX19643.1 AAA family ATPase [Sphingomonas sp. Root1294]KQY65844.1 AAA family ATPase [Sphingomonas sp. Root50]KRB94849.1 AAA family ATPase [Sphingomonas sp. Root720]
MNLFTDDELASGSSPTIEARPLAERLRPTAIEEVVGQEHLTGADAPLARMIGAGRLASMIFWGPPGTGKTTLSRLLADLVGMRFVAFSGTHVTVAELKAAYAEARRQLGEGKRTVLFLDESHRAARNITETLLPVMEDGTIIAILATTEAPSFTLAKGITSRARVLTLNSLDADGLAKLLARAEDHVGARLALTEEARAALFEQAGGDGRYFLNMVEDLLDAPAEEPLNPDDLRRILSRRIANYDRQGDGHYELASAFQKSIRGSDPDAALYYGARLVQAGEDPRFILRRLLVMASEEVAMADPTILGVVTAALDAFQHVGMPEAKYALAQAIVAVATAPKSNAVYLAWKKAMALAEATPNMRPPRRILNAPTTLHRSLGFKQEYEYSHDWPNAFSAQNYWPDELGRHQFYAPNARGFEVTIKRRVDHWNGLREERDSVEGD